MDFNIAIGPSKPEMTLCPIPGPLIFAVDLLRTGRALGRFGMSTLTQQAISYVTHPELYLLDLSLPLIQV